MSNRLSNWNRVMASLVVLAGTMMIGAGQALAVEPKGMLKSKEVKTLVANAKTAADHLKLARHYTAMAEKHEAEAKEHEALAAEYRRNPRVSETKRPAAPDTAAHCEYFAEHCRKAANEMRAMAAAHEEMAKSAGK
jgi:hypothetical protein